MGRRWGKTYTAGTVALSLANRGGAVAWVAPTYGNSRPLWRFLEQVTAPIAKALRINRTERVMEFPGGGRIGLYTADNDVGIRGEAFDLVIIDEAARIREETYFDVILPTLADRGGKCLLISTPKGRNWFYREWQRGRQGETGYASFTAPSRDNPMPLIRHMMETVRTRIPERTYRQEWLAEFLDDAGGIFRYVRQRCVLEPLEPDPGRRYVYGIDWGRTADFTDITIMDPISKRAVFRDRYTDVDFPLQLQRIEALCQRYRPAAIVAESNAIGVPNVEALHRRGLPVIPFNTSNASKANLVDRLTLALEQGNVELLNDPVLIDELESFQGSQLPSGLMKYSAPDGGHDDAVMSTMLALYGIQEEAPMTSEQRQEFAKAVYF